MQSQKGSENAPYRLTTHNTVPQDLVFIISFLMEKLQMNSQQQIEKKHDNQKLYISETNVHLAHYHNANCT